MENRELLERIERNTAHAALPGRALGFVLRAVRNIAIGFACVVVFLIAFGTILPA